MLRHVFQCWDDYWECYYYWNMETRKVSWLPPDDPDAEITDPEIRKGWDSLKITWKKFKIYKK